MLCDVFAKMTSYNTTPCDGKRMQTLMERLVGSNDMQDVSEMFSMILSKLQGEGVDFYPMFSTPGISLATPLTHLLSVDMTKGPTSLHQQLSSAKFCAESRLWPKCLVIELTRLAHDRPAAKSRHPFHFPTSFDTQQYGPALPQPPVYALHAVIVHGTEHFWSYVVKNGSLWKCNDAAVSEVHPQPIDNAIAQGHNATVSMIFYIRNTSPSGSALPAAFEPTDASTPDEGPGEPDWLLQWSAGAPIQPGGKPPAPSTGRPSSGSVRGTKSDLLFQRYGPPTLTSFAATTGVTAGTAFPLRPPAHAECPDMPFPKRNPPDESDDLDKIVKRPSKSRCKSASAVAAMRTRDRKQPPLDAAGSLLLDHPNLFR